MVRRARLAAIPVRGVHPLDRLHVLQTGILEPEEPILVDVRVLRDDRQTVVDDPSVIARVENRRAGLLRAGDQRVERVASA